MYVQQLSPEDGATSYNATIQVGNKRVAFSFTWPLNIEEQYTYLTDALSSLIKNDPLVPISGSSAEIVTEYNYLEYYLKIIAWQKENPNQELSAWIEQQILLPKSIAQMPLMISKTTAFTSRMQECASLSPIILQYKELLRWQFKAVYNGVQTVGCVETGGWYRNQDDELSFRFVSTREAIGKEDLSLVTIEFEVY